MLAGPRDLAPTPIENIPAQKALISPDGTRIAAVGADRVEVYDAASGARVATLPARGAQFAEWSARGAFFVTAFRGAKPADGEAAAKNVQVWDVATQSPVLELHQKSITKESWPVLQWAGDDSGLWHAVTNTVHFYGRAEGFKVIKKVGIKGVGAFAVAPSTAQQLIAAFVPEAKGQPAAACIVDASGGDAVTLSRRSFYRATGGWLGGLKGAPPCCGMPPPPRVCSWPHLTPTRLISPTMESQSSTTCPLTPRALTQRVRCRCPRMVRCTM